MRIAYPRTIWESAAALRRGEQPYRGRRLADRVRMLRVLKRGTVRSLTACGPVLG
jgi:hypothetical protein